MGNNNGNSGLKVLLGVAIGATIGLAIAYLSNEEKRNKLVDDLSDTTDRVRRDIKDAYYEGKIRARKAKRDLSRYMADVRDDAENFYEETVERVRHLGREGKEKTEEAIEYTKEELAELKAEAIREADKFANK